jgi:hypothetical protein
MIQYIDISTDGEVQIVAGKNSQYAFELSNPAIPADIKALLNGVMDIDNTTDLVAVHLERGEGRELAHARYLGGIVVALDGIGTEFDQIMANVSRLAVAIDQVPTIVTGPAVPNLTFAQLMIGLVAEGWITEAEGNAWLVGTLPDPVLLVIDTLPVGEQFAAKARAIRPSEVVRADPLVAALAWAEGKTSEEIDTFFYTYSGV